MGLSNAEKLALCRKILDAPPAAKELSKGGDYLGLKKIMKDAGYSDDDISRVIQTTISAAFGDNMFDEDVGLDED